MKNANEYRYFPITENTDACNVFEKNTFGVKAFMNKYSNISTCHLKKVSTVPGDLKEWYLARRVNVF